MCHVKWSRLSWAILLTVILLSSTTQPAFARDNKPKVLSSNYIGSVSATVSVPIPAEISLNGIAPNASQPIPDGYAYATATLAWGLWLIDGTATTSLSDDVLNTYSLCAQPVQMYKNGTPKGGSGITCGARTGGGSISQKKRIYDIPFGATWRLDTLHGVSGPGVNWWPSMTIYANPRL